MMKASQPVDMEVLDAFQSEIGRGEAVSLVGARVGQIDLSIEHALLYTSQEIK